MLRFMQRWRAGLIVVVALGTARAGSGPAPAVAAFSPAGSVERVEQIKVRFTTPMVAFGDPRLPAPIAGTCSEGATGRWVDAQSYTIDLAQPLAGGRRCRYALVPGLKDAAGARLAPARFAFATGGPNIRVALPADGRTIEEDQVFLLALNAAPTAASLAAHAACAIDGVGEAVPLDILPDATRAKIVASAGSDYATRNFLQKAGQVAPNPEWSEQPQPKAVVVAAQCRRTLPSGGRVSLVWGAGIATADGLATQRPARLDFKIRPAFVARLECSRANPAAACSPIEPISVRFTGQVPVALARQVRLVDAAGKDAATVPFKPHVQTVDELTFKGPFPERARLRVLIPANLTDDAGRPLANAARFPLDTATADAPPLIKFAGTFGIVEAKEGGVLPVTVRAVEPAIAGKDAKVVGGPIGGRDVVVADDATIAQWLRTLDKAEERTHDEEPIAGSDDTKWIETTRSTPLIRANAPARGLTIRRQDARAFEVVGIPLKGNGFHVVELASPLLGKALLGRGGTRYVAAGALVTDMAVHFQWGHGRSLAWVTHLSDATPVAGARIAVSDSCSGRLLATAVTDSAGRAAIRDGLPEPTEADSCDYGERPLMVSARTADDFSFTLTTWSKGIAPSDFSIYGGDAERTAYHTIFDRTLLRAGETVHMKHVIRARTDAGFAPAELPSDPTVVIRHLASDQTYALDLKLGRDGIGETAWAVPAAAALGEYSVEIGERGATERHTSGTFTVEEFRLPTIRARVAGPAKPQVAPSAVPVDLSLAYLAGGAAAHAPVKLRTMVAPRDLEIADYPKFSFTGEDIVPGIVRLDGADEPAAAAPTRAQVVPVTLSAGGTARVVVDRLPPVTVPSTLSLEMDYDDANGEVATAKGSVSLDPAAVRVGIAKDGWIMKADAAHLQVVALDLANRPVAGQHVDVRLFSRETYSYRKRLIGGFYAYDNSRETKALGRGCSGATDDRGLFRCTLDAGVSGEAIALVTAKDAAGHVSRATQSLWLAGDDDWWFGGDNGDRMDVVPEAPEYPAGGVARFQVRMPFREATALVSVLRDGVIDSFVTTLSGKEPVVAVQLKRGYAPDVYVSVLAVRGRVAGWRLWLADLARRWNLPWLSRDAAYPTALVDLAKPSYRFGLAKIRVGWDDHRLGVRVATDSPTYAVRKTAQATVTVTPPRGRALPPGSEIAFAAIDEALLQLHGNDSWDVLTAMMADRPLSVFTSTAQTQVVGKRHYGRKALAAGGGGGEGAGGTVRRDFNPLLLWRGRVPLDVQGRASLPVTMNDSLSAFRLVAVATAGSDLFGTGAVTVRTTQDLQLLAGIPPLVREGDHYTATVLARNATAKAMRVSLSGTAGAAALAPRIVDIPAGEATTVAWDVAAPAEGKIQWAIAARATSGATDAVQVTQAVAPAVPVETLQATLVQVAPQQSFPVALPATALPGRGGVDVALSRSLGGSLPGVRAYMAAYPYDCIEQRLSVAVAAGDRARWDAAAALLPAYLDRDGLVRFFPADWIAGDDSLTAYLLRLSADSGWPLPADVKAKMVAGLTGFVGGHVARPHDNVLVVEKGKGIVGTASFTGEGASRRLAAIAGLMSANAATPAMVEPISVTPDAWDTATLIDWLTVLRLPGIPDAEGKRAQAETVLRARLDLQGTRLSITRADDAWQLLGSRDLTAARLLQAIVALPDWRADAPRIARGLMLDQSRGHWDTTPANAVGTLAMRAFSARFEATPVAGTTTATLGGARHVFDWSTTPPPATLAWPPAAASLTLTHAGAGAPWAIVTSRAAVPLTAPFSSGFAVRRAVSAMSQAVPGRWSRGDVMKVHLEVTPRAPLAWVVVNDPVPAGATVLGGSLGGRSDILAAGATAGVQPTFVERRTEAVHAHYEAVTRATIAYDYTLRLNSAGTFRLPPTRVEALYSPEMMALVPNAPLTVAAAPAR
ncbi:MAG: alpha-2-macroglobulin [Sphingomonadaceae bacterium]|nr:alpha-2-macroglobulin [Sphingomonadaceae bacterium]